VVDQLLMCVSFDAPRRADLQQFLSATDHPLILDALAARWRTVFLPDPLVAEAVVANPHVVPRASGDVLLAVAKDRLDLVDDDEADTADALLRGTGLTGMAERYRRALRQLGPGAARERVCEIAQWRGMPGQQEALSAAIDADYLPADERDRAVFLFRTEQWERYAAADPDGELLYAAWVASRTSHDQAVISLSYEISEVARRTGRTDPAERWLASQPPVKTELGERPSRGRGPIGGISGAWGEPGGSVHT
jgi:hypothetical protein